MKTTRSHPSQGSLSQVGIVSLVLAASSCGSPLLLGADTSPARFRAGASRVDITPTTLPIRVAGSIGERYADHVTDPLHARGLVLDDGKLRIVLCMVDNCLLPRSLIDSAKAEASRQTGIPTERMLVAATHTHSAPPVTGIHGNDPVEEYAAFLQSRITESIVKAYRNLAPAQAGWGAGRCEEYVFCRRWVMKPGAASSVPFTGHASNEVQMNPGRTNPNKIRQTGPVDPAVTVLSIQNDAGRPLALLANYSTHYAGAPDVSADYFGEFDRILTEKLALPDEAIPFVAMMSNGTSGDANCIDFSRDQEPFTHQKVAQKIAAIVLETCQAIQYSKVVPLAMAEETLELPVRMPSAEEATAARHWLSENLPDGRVRNSEQNYARETVLLSQMPPTRSLKLQAIRIGRLGVTAIPCEVYGSTGLNIKAGSPLRPTMNIGLANGYEGYLPPPDQHLLGGYTTWRARSSCLEVEAEPKIVRTIMRLLREVSGQ